MRDGADGNNNKDDDADDSDGDGVANLHPTHYVDRLVCQGYNTKWLH